MRNSERIPLRLVQVQKPCHEDWNGMSGDEKIRFCSKCREHVHNLSEMTPKEAKSCLDGAEGRICVRYELDEKGRIKHRSSMPKLLTLIAAATLSLVGCAPQQEPLMGDVATPPKQEPRHEPMMGAVAPDPVMGKVAAPQNIVMGDLPVPEKKK